MPIGAQFEAFSKKRVMNEKRAVTWQGMSQGLVQNKQAFSLEILATQHTLLFSMFTFLPTWIG
jgi:hypothetical protein